MTIYCKKCHLPHGADETDADGKLTECCKVGWYRLDKVGSAPVRVVDVLR